MRVISADFETITDPDDCRVWAAGWCDIDDLVMHYTNDIGSFMRDMSDLHAYVYFHNIGFDGCFMLDWLFRNGFTHTTGRKVRRGEFATVISKDGKFYSLTVRWLNGVRTEFRDSYKKFPISVAALAKSFGTEETKLHINYDKYRAPGHVLTDEEQEYLRSDVIIVAKALRQAIAEGMKRLTVGADSLAEYKSLHKQFNRDFPVLGIDIDSDIRLAYRGGFTYVAKRYTQRMLGNGIVLDVNSLYPYVMRTKLLPYGVPIWREGPPQDISGYPLWILSVTFTAKLKRNHIPCIQIKGTPWFHGTEYQEKIEESVTLAFSSVDWELINQQYDVDVESYNGAWYFHGSFGLFDTYIDKWRKIKENSTGGTRFIAKLHLNSLYGKFATNPDVTQKIPYFDNDVVKFRQGRAETRDPVYTAMGVFITAYARQKTILTAQQNYKCFAYADTDSMHLLVTEPPEGVDIHNSRLGAWKIESEFERSFFIRPKAYLEQAYDGRFNVHIAGLPATVASQLTFDDVHDGAEFTGKLLPKHVAGGIVLTEIGYKLNY